LIANTSNAAGALAEIVQTRGLLPLHPGDPAEMFATTGVPPLTLTEADFAAGALLGIVTTTFAVTFANGFAIASEPGLTRPGRIGEPEFVVLEQAAKKTAKPRTALTRCVRTVFTC
jgi:hypothetical protein